MSRRSSGQRRGAAANSVPLATGSVSGAVLGAGASFISGLVPTALSSAGQSLYGWYQQRQAVAQYGALAGPVIFAVSTVTLSQAGQILGLIKTITKMIKPSVAEVAPIVPPKYEYAVLVDEPSTIPVGRIVTGLSLISLRCPDIPSVNVAGFKSPVLPMSKVAKLVLAAQCVAWFGDRLWASLKSPIGAVLATKLITHTLLAGPLSSSQMRQVFTDTPLVRSANKPKNHTHAESANDRNAGGCTAECIAQQLGLTPYFLQKSLADTRKGRAGDRSYHWAKDIGVPAEEFHFDPQKHACIQVDVDHFIDMPHLLANYPGVHFLSTFQPTAAARGIGEYTFRFHSDGTVEYRVSGGAVFRHHVWNYTGDTIVVEDSGYPMKRVVCYHMDRKRLDDHHVLVMLSPIGMFQMPAIIPTKWVIDGPALERLNPIRGNHVVIDVVRPDCLERSVALAGSHLSVTKPKQTLDAVHAVAVVAKVAITAGMVESNISPPGKDGMPKFRLEPGQGSLIASYLRERVPLFPPTVCPPSACLVPVYYSKDSHEGTLPLAGFGAPLVMPNYGHVRDLASENQCIAGRLEKFTSRKFEQDIPPSLAKYMTEFVKFLVPEHLVHTGRPLGHEEVHERQDRPSQRHILDTAESSGPWYKKLFRSFLKPEPYQKVTDPRNITTVTPETKLQNSRFMYAFHDGVMAIQPNYAFNKTPREVAEFVARRLKCAPFGVIGDGSRFDGHVERRARILERMAMFRYFHPDEHDELNETMDEQIGMPGVTAEGRRYASAFSRGSGTLETADFNSVDTMFIGYCGWRNTVVDGQKCSPELAWKSLGIYGGDDSLEANVDPAALKKAAELMGQDYEIEVYQRGQAGMNILNRTFGPHVWDGDPSSMANPARLLSKLFIGPAQLHNPLDRFAERMSGYYKMDLNSPVVGVIARAAHQLLGERTEGVLSPWGSKYSPESNWPNEDSGWMDDVFIRSIPDFDHDRFREWIKQCLAEGPAMLLRAPMCTPPPPQLPEAKVAAVVGDELQLPPKEKEDMEEVDTEREEAGQKDLYLGQDAPATETSDETTISEEVKVADKAVPKCDSKGLKKKPRAQKPENAYDPKRPDLWTPPKDPERLADWKKHQAKVARRLGITLK